MILAARETLGGHANSGLLPRALAELILAARETPGGHDALQSECVIPMPCLTFTQMMAGMCMAHL